jgi:hypothetical protein
MEQAIISIKLVVRDTSQIDRTVKDIEKKLEKSSKGFGLNIASSIKKINWGATVGNFGRAMTNSLMWSLARSSVATTIGAGVVGGFALANNETTKANGIIDHNNDDIFRTKTLSSISGGNMAKSEELRYLLKASGLRNPEQLIMNFMEKLSKATNGENPLLEDFTKYGDGATAMIEFLKFIQTVNPLERSKVMSKVFGKQLADNASALLKFDIGGVQQDRKKMFEKNGIDNPDNFYNKEFEKAMYAERLRAMTDLDYRIKEGVRVNEELLNQKNKLEGQIRENNLKSLDNYLTNATVKETTTEIIQTVKNVGQNIVNAVTNPSENSVILEKAIDDALRHTGINKNPLSI